MIGYCIFHSRDEKSRPLYREGWSWIFKGHDLLARQVDLVVE